MLLIVCFVKQMQYICQGKYKSLLNSEYFLSEIVLVFLVKTLYCI